MKKLRFVLCSLLAFLLIATSIPVVTEAAAKPVCQKATTLSSRYGDYSPYPYSKPYVRY